MRIPSCINQDDMSLSCQALAHQLRERFTVVGIRCNDEALRSGFSGSLGKLLDAAGEQCTKNLVV